MNSKMNITHTDTGYMLYFNPELDDDKLELKIFTRIESILKYHFKFKRTNDYCFKDKDGIKIDISPYDEWFGLSVYSNSREFLEQLKAILEKESIWVKLWKRIFNDKRRDGTAT